MEKLRQYIWVTFQKEGIHKYPQALTDPKLESVSFLGYPHRHIFHFKVSIEVFHDDRDVEFIMFKRWLESLYHTNTLQLDYKSCEMISDDLAGQIELEYGNKDVPVHITIEVSEDGENGSSTNYIV